MESGPIINGRQYASPSLDLENAPFWCFPGRAIFATPKHDEQTQTDAGVHLSHQTASIRRLPVATCVRASYELDLLVGNDYVVHQGLAKRVQDLRVGKWRFPKEDGELWLFGCTSPRKGQIVDVHPNSWLNAELDEKPSYIWQTEECPYPLRDVPLGLRAHDALSWGRDSRKVVGTCILSLPAPKKERNGLVLIDRHQEWPDMAVVLAVSPACKTVKPGMVVWYQRAGLHGWGHLPELNFASIHETAIFAAVDI